MGRKTYLVTTLLIVSSLVTPILSLQSSQSIRYYGTISYSAGLLYGVCSHPWVLTERDCQEMKRLGVKYVRMGFIWERFQPSEGAPFDFSEYDRYLKWMEANDLEFIALLLRVPTWLRPPGGDEWSIPAGAVFDEFVMQYGEFVHALVDHYKGSITYFEIWNEPNIIEYWNDPEATMEKNKNRGVAIAKYVTLLKQAYTRAKEANPNSKVISGGLSENDHVYVQGMYDAGAKGYFDFLGAHPYFWHGPEKNYDPDHVRWDHPEEYAQFPKIQWIRDAMVNNGDGDKKIFITELGVDGHDGPEGHTTEEIQARALRRVFEKIDHDPGYPFINAVMWYEFRDGIHTTGSFGLLREDYTSRQMYYSYKDIIGS